MNAILFLSTLPNIRFWPASSSPQLPKFRDAAFASLESQIRTSEANARPQGTFSSSSCQRKQRIPLRTSNPSSCRLGLLVLLRNLLDREACYSVSVACNPAGREHRTRGQALLQLLGLLRVEKDQGVEMSLAADLELDLLGALVLLDSGGYGQNR